MIATVIPATKTKSETNSFTYLVPENLTSEIKVGSLVSVPFGKRNIRGIVSGLSNEKSEALGFKLKEIKQLDRDFSLPQSYQKVADWLAAYYCCSLGEAISLFLPPEMKRPRKSDANNLGDRKEVDISLNNCQKEIFCRLKESLGQPKRPALLHGVTSSGKTEIYIKLAEETLKNDRQVVVLVPEIILTPQTVERFQKVFGDQIALMHSNLSKSEKYQCFFDFYFGRKKILIGPRSALLVPSEKIGLIVIDEEHEDAYKQEQSPRYHAVTVAEKVASETGALLLMGSATPRVETYHKAQTGLYDLFVLDKRFGEKEMPVAKTIDLRNEIKYGNFSPLSMELQAALHHVMAEKRQALLFLNRRGSATFVSCRDCGFIKLCPHCSIPLVYHTNSQDESLSCHHCGHKEHSITICPECGSSKVKYFGAGIERIEKEVRLLFPDARIVKIDSSTFTSKKDYENFYQSFKNHEIDIAIGTQIIAKGLDIPNLDLVGIISADTGLHLPQYKASEKTFQIITQVSGRSGRRENDGKTIIQTYWPEAEAIVSASTHDYRKFYETEIAERKLFCYPPFCHLIRIIAEEEDDRKALLQIQKLKAYLDQLKLVFIGPGPCFYSKLHNKYRYHIIIKSQELPNKILQQIQNEFSHLIYDVDPTNLL